MRHYSLSKTLALSGFLSVACGMFIASAAQSLDQTLIAAGTQEPKPSHRANLASEYYCQQGDSVVRIRAMAAGEHQASVLINDREVVRFRTSRPGASPLARARHMASTLHGYLSNQGAARGITPALSGNTPVIRAGSHELVVLDAPGAALAKQADAHQLALVWTNQIRQALGAPPITRGLAVASRSLISREETRTPVAAPSAALLDSFSRPGGTFLGSGMASWYGPGFHGRRSSDGTRFDMNQMTAAHRTLPFGTLVRVHNKRTGKHVVVRISDRGPFIAGRILDVSRAAAVALGMLGSGVAPVSIESVGKLPNAFWRVSRKASTTTSASVQPATPAAPAVIKLQPQLEMDTRAEALAQAGTLVMPSPQQPASEPPASQDDVIAAPALADPLPALAPSAPSDDAPAVMPPASPEESRNTDVPLTLFIEDLTPAQRVAAQL